MKGVVECGSTEYFTIKTSQIQLFAVKVQPLIDSKHNVLAALIRTLQGEVSPRSLSDTPKGCRLPRGKRLWK